jgi:hypothetical protein
MTPDELLKDYKTPVYYVDGIAYCADSRVPVMNGEPEGMAAAEAPAFIEELAERFGYHERYSSDMHFGKGAFAGAGDEWHVVIHVVTAAMTFRTCCMSHARELAIRLSTPSLPR